MAVSCMVPVPAASFWGSVEVNVMICRRYLEVYWSPADAGCGPWQATGLQQTMRVLCYSCHLKMFSVMHRLGFLTDIFCDVSPWIFYWNSAEDNVWLYQDNDSQIDRSWMACVCIKLFSSFRQALYTTGEHWPIHTLMVVHEWISAYVLDVR